MHELLTTTAKKQVLQLIREKGNLGVSESDVLQKLYDFNRQYDIFGYSNNSTPEALIEGLIFRRLITRSCQYGARECRYFSIDVLVED